MDDRWWGKLKIEDRIQQDCTILAVGFPGALAAVCKHFDLTRPIVTRKHENEMDQFGRTVFYPDDFIESVPFDTMEIEIIRSKKKK